MRARKERNEREVYDMVSFKWDDNLAKKIAVEESREEGLREGKVSAIAEMAVKLLKKSYPLTDVVDITELSPEEVREIAKKHGLVC